MIGETSRARNPAGRAGVFANLVALANALAGFIESRLALIANESKAALVQILVLVGCVVGALIFFSLGYVFLIASAVVSLAQMAQVSWVWIALGAAGAHFLLAFIFLLVARNRMSANPFPETAAELRKDRAWLRDLNDTSRPTN